MIYILISIFLRLMILIITNNDVEGIQFVSPGESVVTETANTKEVILNCPYQLNDGDEEGLVITWYYNDTPEPVYQWIPFRQPQAMGLLRNFADLTYESSDRDYYKYKNVRLVSPSPSLTGRYTCKVSSFQEEKRYVVYLVLFATPSTFEVNVVKRSDDIMTVKCNAHPVSPEPRLTIFKSVNSKRIPLRDGHFKSVVSEGAYNVSIRADVRNDQLDGMTLFECHLSIPGTDITLKRTVKFIPRTLPSIRHMYATVSNSESLNGEVKLLVLPLFILYILKFVL